MRRRRRRIYQPSLDASRDVAEELEQEVDPPEAARDDEEEQVEDEVAEAVRTLLRGGTGHDGSPFKRQCGLRQKKREELLVRESSCMLFLLLIIMHVFYARSP